MSPEFKVQVKDDLQKIFANSSFNLRIKEIDVGAQGDGLSV